MHFVPAVEKVLKNLTLFVFIIKAKRTCGIVGSKNALAYVFRDATRSIPSAL